MSIFILGVLENEVGCAYFSLDSPWGFSRFKHQELYKPRTEGMKSTGMGTGCIFSIHLGEFD